MQDSQKDHLAVPTGTAESLSVAAHGIDPRLQQRYVVEWGAISLPLGHPSRITSMAVHDTFAEASAAAEACECDARVFAIHIPDPAREPGACPACDKCKKPITTGAMAILCEHGEQCALVDDNWESIKDFRDAFGVDQK